MKYAKQVTIVFQDPTECNKAYQQLKYLDLGALVVVNSITELRQVLDQDQDALILLSVPTLPLALMVANVRSILGGGGIIVVAQQTQPFWVSELLIAGADVALTSVDNDCTELLAWQTVLRRRAEHFLNALHLQYSEKQKNVIPAVHKPIPSVSTGSTGVEVAQHSTWRLVDRGWRLLSPMGASISLTYSEKLFLLCFAGQVDKRLSREQLLGKNAIQNENSRAIDSLISRLRRKALEQNFSLPVKSVHGWGYSFIGLLLTESESAADHLIDTMTQQSYYEELSSFAEFEQQLLADRFGFTYLPVLDSTTDKYCGAKVSLVWHDKNSNSIPLTNPCFYAYLEQLGAIESLFVWALAELKAELRSWHTEYELDVDLNLTLPVQVLLREYLNPVDTEQTIYTPNLHFSLCHIDQSVDMTVLASCLNNLKEQGVSVWLCEESVQKSYALSSSLAFFGMSICCDDQGMTNVARQQSIGFAKEHNLPLLVEGVSSVEQRKYAMALEAQYMSGDMVSLPLSRDALLLAWASRGSMA